MNVRWAVPALAGLVLALLVANGTVVVVRAGDSVGEVTAIPEQLKPVLSELEAFVQQNRGLQFKRPPKVKLIADSEFESLLLDTNSDRSDNSSADAKAFLGVLSALGLITDPVDLDNVAQKQAGDIVGFYDSQKKALYVRGVDPTPYAKEVLVHELTHALDDQYFGLDRSSLDNADEAASAFQALVEGNALFVEQKWYRSRSPEERDAIDAAEDPGADAAGTADAAPPDVFDRLMAFPYAVGLPFVEAVVDAGGRARLDATFRDPPVTTEQVLHPDRFLAGEGQREVPLPQADGKIIDEGSVGELGLILVTGTANTRADSRRASEGWAGDSYRAWTEGNQTCIRWDIVMDTSTDTTELVAALQAWANGQPGSTVTQNGPIEVTNCR